MGRAAGRPPGLNGAHRANKGTGRPGKAGARAAGERGEALAARYLEKKGYRIVARNFRCPYGEIDLIASQGEYLVFVEVKTRRGRTAFDPALAVNARKMDKLRALAAYYLAAHYVAGHPQDELQPRFDVIAVMLAAAGPRVRHIENAF
jgi:putative endonuclease